MLILVLETILKLFAGAIHLKKLFDSIQQKRTNLLIADPEPYDQFPTEGKDLYDFDTVLTDLNMLKETSALQALTIQENSQLTDELIAISDNLRTQLRHYIEQEQVSASKIQSLSEELALEQHQTLEMTNQLGLMLDEHDNAARPMEDNIQRLAQENLELKENVTAQEQLLREEKDKNAAYERKLEFLQSERVRLQAEVDKRQTTISELDQDIDLLNEEIERLTVATVVQHDS
jgi:chromosome segregation ATPase